MRAEALAVSVALATCAIAVVAAIAHGLLRLGRRYHAGQALAALGHGLASTHTIDAVDAQTRNILARTIRPNRANLLLRQDDGTFRATGPPAQRQTLTLPAWRIARLERGEPQLRQEEEGIGGSTEESSWTGLEAEILVPIRAGDSLRGVLALGRKESARSYSADDVSFLRAAAGQIALALSNASALQESEGLRENLRALDENLERQVDERTKALHASNAALNESLGKLQHAYVKLEQSQANLLRADRLATLGRLTAGLAHEMNTPLSAVLNSLKLIRDLSQEYRSSIDDAGVLPEDHREIARELISHAECATEWANKAAAFIRSVKAHGREAGSGVAQRFAIRDVVADVRGLIAHRLRATSCRIELVEEPAGITLDGDPSRFNQVLVNLLTNAIDAYEDRVMNDACIEIRAWHRDDSVCVQVRDWAGGIPTSILPHIFDELYTTKGPGRGTGLGLWISRTIVEEALGGTLDVITNSEGSCFIAEFPRQGANLQPVDTESARPARDGTEQAA
jgi:signal transduction histidine kinase